MAVNEQVVIELVARTEAAEAQIAALTAQLNKTKVAAKQASEDGLERLTKNGGAMGILNDLTGGLAMQFKDAHESIQLTNTGLKGMRAALIATGIGAAVVAIGALVANWEDITNWIKAANDNQKQFLDTAEAIRAVSKDQVEALSRQENILRQQGFTEDEILQKKRDAISLDSQILALQIAINQRALDNSIQRQKDNVESLGFLGKLMGLRAEETDEMNGQRKAIADQKKEQENLLNTLAGIDLQLEANRKAAEDKRLQNQNTYNDQLTANLKAREKDEIDSVDRVTQKQREAIAERQRLLEDAEYNAALTRLQGIEKSSEDAKKYLDEAKQRDKDEADYKRSLQVSGFALANSLNDLLFSKQGQQSRAGFRIAKALGMAEAGVNTYKAAGAAYATAAASPYAIVNPAYPAIMAGIAVAFGVAQVAKIAATQYGGGAASGGQGSPPNAPGGGAPTPTNPQAALDFSFLSQQQPVQTYVIAGDVTNAQEANQKLKDQSAL